MTTKTMRFLFGRFLGKRVPIADCIALMICALFGLTSLVLARAPLPNAAHPGARSVMDAHNCYPYFGWWNDRIDRALSAGTPLAIEQDLLWYTDKRTGQSRSIVTHGVPSTGHEPNMRDYFFEKVRPVVEQALRSTDHHDWPLITVNLDLKSDEPEHLEAIWKLLAEYRDWLTTAPRGAQIGEVAALDVKPILVLTGEADTQKAVFYDRVPVGERLLVFGATHTHTENVTATADVIAPDAPDNYHRWWNNAWNVIEPGGQPNAGEWNAEKEKRLGEFVAYAHQRGFWIRFYTLDGVTVQEESCLGLFHGYNFGSRAAAEQRWRAAAKAGVDYIASDQYEALGQMLKK
jgi:hypothetical protein